jgi:hypothetical protein
MHVKRFFGVFAEGLHNGESERYIGNKHTVHHVQMKPIGLALVYHFNITPEIQEVGCQE